MNCISIMGRMVADPKAQVTNSGKDVASFRIAVDRGVVDGERKADFFDCVAWGKTATFIDKYFHKGSMIALTGRLQSRQWEDKNGQKRATIEIVADRAYFCGGKEGAGNASAAGNDNSRKVNEKAADVVYGGDEYAEIDDSEDLPF